MKALEHKDRRWITRGLLLGVAILTILATSAIFHFGLKPDDGQIHVTYSASEYDDGEADKPMMEVGEEFSLDDTEPLEGTARSSHWPTVMHHFIKNEFYDDGKGAHIYDDLHKGGHWRPFKDGVDRSRCRCCGSKKNLNVHHIDAFRNDQKDELNPFNLVTLCRDHHFHVGHRDPKTGKCNWSNINPNVCRECDEMNAKLNPNR